MFDEPLKAALAARKSIPVVSVEGIGYTSVPATAFEAAQVAMGQKVRITEDVRQIPLKEANVETLGQLVWAVLASPLIDVVEVRIKGGE